MTDNQYLGQLVMTDYIDDDPELRKCYAIGMVTGEGNRYDNITYRVEWLNANFKTSFYYEDDLKQLIDKYNVMRQTSTGAFR